jgi:hypothetical protein
MRKLNIFMKKSCPRRRGRKEEVEENDSEDVGRTRWGETIAALDMLVCLDVEHAVCLETENVWRRKRAGFLRPEWSLQRSPGDQRTHD